MSNGCEKFHRSSKAFKRCHESNAFREMHGLAPIEGLEDAPLVIEPPQAIQTLSRPQIVRREPSAVKRGCGGCGGARPVTVPQPPITQKPVIAGGPGTCLKEIFAATGAPICPACEELASKMDAWGVAGCFDRMEDIVADILPRALAWEAEKLGWFAKLIPEKATEASVRLLVHRALGGAIPPVKKKRNAIRSPRYAPVTHFTGSRPPFDGPIIRNLIMHIWPTRNGAWQWNLDQLLCRIHLFNGKRVMGIATDDETCSASDVVDYVKGFGFDFVYGTNNKRLGEMVTFNRCLERVRSTSPNEATFRCHAKGAKYPDFGKDSHAVKQWTESMYTTCLDDWPAIENALNTHVMVGPFKRDRGLGAAFHYSGAFYWFAHDPVFRRQWDRAPSTYAGAEIWPARVAAPAEAACVFKDHAGNLYDLKYWRNEVTPEYEEWKKIRSEAADIRQRAAILCRYEELSDAVLSY